MPDRIPFIHYSEPVRLTATEEEFQEGHGKFCPFCSHPAQLADQLDPLSYYGCPACGAFVETGRPDGTERWVSGDSAPFGYTK